jgi:hypothetical protein
MCIKVCEGGGIYNYNEIKKRLLRIRNWEDGAGLFGTEWQVWVNIEGCINRLAANFKCGLILYYASFVFQLVI